MRNQVQRLAVAVGAVVLCVAVAVVAGGPLGLLALLVVGSISSPLWLVPVLALTACGPQSLVEQTEPDAGQLELDAGAGQVDAGFDCSDVSGLDAYKCCVSTHGAERDWVPGVGCVQ